MLPRIGISLQTDPAYAGYRIRKDYCELISAAGAIPLLLPDQPPRLAGEVLHSLEGLLLSGGGDLPPQSYGQGPWQRPAARDLWELALLREAWQRRLPILGICRGFQALQVSQGGALLQELTAAGFPGHQQSLPRQAVSHPLRLCHPFLQRLYGREQIWVNSFHHQGVNVAAEGLSIGAVAPDGLIEALLHLEEDRFALGLQWHPEALHSQEAFRALVAAARRRNGNIE